MRPPEVEPNPALSASAGIRPPAIALLFVIVTAVVSIPVVTHPLPPLSDYINSLAGAYVISVIGADADLQRFYAVEWQIIPNLMMNLVMPALHRVMDVYRAGQVFTMAALILILSGTFAFNRALFGRWSALPLLAGPLLYNEVLLVGVMNYIFGIGLALWALAAWVALRERGWPWRMAVSTVFVLLLFICHLYALGLYAIGLLALELHRLWTRRSEPLSPRLADFCATGLPFLPALGLLMTGPTSHSPGVPAYWEWWGKIDGLWLAVGVYDRRLAAAFVVAVIAAAAIAARRGLLRLHPAIFAIAAIGSIVYLAMPRALFASHLADQRLPTALAFMLIACLDLDLHSLRVRQISALLLAGLLAVRIAEVQLVWDRLAPDIADFRQSVLSIERGAHILVAHADRTAFSKGIVSDFGLLHAASLATIERSALVSTIFAVKGKHVLQVREPFRRFVDTTDGVPPSADWLKAAAGAVDDRLYWSQWPQHFDYVYVVFVQPGQGNPDAEHLLLAREGLGFQLYRVIKKS